MKDILEKYFREAIQTDSALAAAYRKDKLSGAVDYITKQAGKRIKGQSGYIEDAVVYKWARDFMYGHIEAENTPAPIHQKPDKSEEEVKPVVVSKKVEEEQPQQLNLFNF